MLRRACFTSTVSASASSSFFAAAAAASRVVSASRSTVIFTEQNTILANNAKHLGYKSNLWVEERDDKWWYEGLTKLKKDEKPTEIRIERNIEYLNLSFFENFREKERELPKLNPGEQGSVRTQRPFKPVLARALAAAAREDPASCKSCWWVNRKELSDVSGLGLLFRASNGVVRSKEVSLAVFTNVYNADQFENPDALTLVPLSGGRKVPFGSSIRSKLSDAIAQNKWKSGLFFSPNQMRRFGLQAVDGAVPILVPPNFKNRTRNDSNYDRMNRKTSLYNLEQLQRHDEVLKSLHRFPVDEHSYLLSGKLVSGIMLERVKSVEGKYKSKYWLNEMDRSQRRWPLKEGERPLQDGAEGKSSSSSSSSTPAEDEKYYHVSQLTAPATGFQVAGSSFAQKRELDNDKKSNNNDNDKRTKGDEEKDL